MKIDIEARIDAPVDVVWAAWTSPDAIKAWNAASDDWHTTQASLDLREGGAFSFRMEAKDGSVGFDFGGTYTRVVPGTLIDASLGDRQWLVTFEAGSGGTVVRESFDAESTHTVEQQRAGWQAILDSFARYVARTHGRAGTGQG